MKEAAMLVAVLWKEKPAKAAGRTAANASLFSQSRGTFMCLICISIR